jgi:hypothetical protein
MLARNFAALVYLASFGKPEEAGNVEELTHALFA